MFDGEGIGSPAGAQGSQDPTSRTTEDTAREKISLARHRGGVGRDPTLWAEVEDDYELRERARATSCTFTATIPGRAAVYDAILWPQERGIICATADGNVYVLALASEGPGTERGQEERNESVGDIRMVLEGHEDMVTTLALSADGRHLLSGSLDKTIRVWDLGSVQEERNRHRIDRTERDRGVEGHPKPNMCHIAPKRILEGHTSRINCLRWSPSGTTAISSSTDSTLRLWDIAKGICLSEMKGHGSLVSSIDLSKEGTVCASASGDTVCNLWRILGDNTSDGRVETGAELIDRIAWDSGPVVLCRFVDYASHGQYLLTAHAQLVQQQARILLWDIFDKETGWVDGKLRAPCYAIDDLRGCPTSMDTTRVASGEFAGTELLACSCSDGKVHLWDINECPVKLATFSLEGAGHTISEDTPAWSVAHLRHASNKLNLVSFSPSGRYLAATRSESNSVVIWEVDEGEEISHIYGHTKPIRKLLWVSDYKLISISDDGTIRGLVLAPRGD